MGAPTSDLSGKGLRYGFHSNTGTVSYLFTNIVTLIINHPNQPIPSILTRSTDSTHREPPKMAFARDRQYMRGWGNKKSDSRLPGQLFYITFLSFSFFPPTLLPNQSPPPRLDYFLPWKCDVCTRVHKLSQSRDYLGLNPRLGSTSRQSWFPHP